MDKKPSVKYSALVPTGLVTNKSAGKWKDTGVACTGGEFCPWGVITPDSGTNGLSAATWTSLRWHHN